MCALSEVQWCTAENKDPERFRKSMEHSFRILDRLGYGYCPCLDENPENERYKGLYLNYEFSAEKVVKPAPKGYEPFYVSYIGRYGASYFKDERSYEIIAHVLANASLTPLGKEIKEKFEEIHPLVKGRAGSLTPIGCSQQRVLAERMCKAFPEIFAGDCNVSVSSSEDQRCLQSRDQFVESLKESCPALNMVCDEDSDVSMILAMKPADPVDKDEILYQFANPQMLYTRMFTDVEAAEGLCHVPDFVRALYHFGTHLGCLGIDDRLMETAFTDEMASALAFVDDYICSNDCGWNKKENIMAACDVIERLMMILDNDISSSDVDARLMFCNEETVMTLMSLLNIGVFSERIFNSDDVPVSANIKWIFAKNDAGDVLVKVQYNESDRTEWMPWNEYRNNILTL